MHVPQTEVILRHDGAELAHVTLPPGDYVIGRSEEAEIFADTPLISRRHARLVIDHDQLLLEDLGSSNGTFVGGQRISESTRLFPNQHVRLGDVVLEVRRERAPTAMGLDLAPAQAAIRRLLPDELLAKKRYAIGGQVARGGMGAIMHARQQATQRDVAMKVMLESQDETGVLRFIDEAQVTAQLEHPNIVPIYELGVDEQDHLFYTMKFVRGITLKKVLELLGGGIPETVKKYPLSALLTIFQKTCDALAFAHAKGVIHRDLKPDNLMLGDFGEVLVMDWGLAKVLGQIEPTGSSGAADHVLSTRRQDPGDSSRTLSGAIMGTPQYMSPEQARGEIETLDARSDVYALGAILFEIIYLRPPVGNGDVTHIIHKVAQGVVEWQAATPPAALPHLPGGRAPDSLVAVCRKALAFDADQRYGSVTDLQRDLEAYQNGFATSAEKAGAWKQFRLFILRNRAVSTSIAAAFVIVAAVTAIFTLNVVRARNRAESTLHELRGTAPTFAAQARALVEEGKLDEALEKITYARQLDPRNADYLLQQANDLEIALRLHDAVAAYRNVLTSRPGDAGAQQNLDLCEHLLAENGGRDDLSQPILVKLVDALLAQGRQVEANPLAQRVGKGTATTEAALHARLKEIIAQPGWNSGRIRVQPNGTFALNFNSLHVKDLSALHGFPVSSLDVDDPNFRDLAPLAGLPLTHLGLSRTDVTDLTPLAGLPLESLYLRSMHIADLRPLRGMKLRELYLSNLNLVDLQPLAGMQLEKLDISGNNITDIALLRGMPLRELILNGNHIPDLSPLADLPLEMLNIASMDLTEFPTLHSKQLRSVNLGGNRVSDLRPLAGFKLTYLSLWNTPVQDIAPLRGMPLQNIDLGTDVRAIDLTPLADCRDLEEITVPKWFYHEEVLRSLPKLRRAKLYPFQSFALPMKQFWTELKPDWVHLAHARAIIQFSGLKFSSVNPVNLDPDGSLHIDINHAAGGPIPSFAGLPISRFNADFSTFSDLSPLRGLPLWRLSLNTVPIADLSPLAGMAIQSLSVNGTKVKDFSPLRGMPLQEIYVSNLGLTDLAFLRGRPLQRLDMGNNHIADISVLAGMPLEWLVASGTDVADITPLRGMPLKYLSLSRSRVRDFGPLRGSPLVELNAEGVPVQDFSPLLDLPKLEKLRVFGTPQQLAVLRKHPTVKFMALGPVDPLRATAQFWEDYDAAQAKRR